MRFVDEIDGLPEAGPRSNEGDASGSTASNDTLEDSIRAGDELHDAVRSLAMRGYTRERLEQLLNESTAKTDRPDRWREVMESDLPRALKSAAAKRDKEMEKIFAAAGIPPLPRYQTDAFETFSAATLHGKPIPPQRWLARDLIPAAQPALLSGDGGDGKSLLALQLAVAVATGGQWLGQFTAQGPALYLSAEDEKDEIHRRLNRIVPGGLDKLGDLHIAPMAEMDALLVAPQGGRLDITPLFKALAARIEQLRPAFVVFDSNADFYGGNEVVRAEVRWFIGQLRKLCHRFGCTILILSHPSVSGMQSGSGLSGSTHWNNSVRARLYLTRAHGEGADPDERVLEVLKANRGALGKRIVMRWQAGAFVACQEPEKGQTTEADVDEFFVDMLTTYNRRKMNVTTSTGATYAPSVFSKEPAAKARKITRNMLIAAMGRVMDEGRVVPVAHRTGADARYHLEVADPGSK